ncbi:fructose PTS transporter subunit IIA [Neobacillus cucumis]|uniref:PTS sugar transporter subunit IIA n=1 Tax=Neobacillus cucumis TaxID=1740721 RepID=UPI002040A408|nr:fructose PTS transporter subunit IIA [Neobacillus cucumis]MCM3729362.1 fructose PTS transporter subunit IIA [Neobacillus cucumis]
MDIFNLNCIHIKENLHSQKEAFERIAELAVLHGLAISQKPVVEGLFKREQEGTTGFLDGFAIPHTKSAAIQKPGVIILKSASGIEWESMDGTDVKFIISLLIPENEAGTTHLTLLSHISRILIHNDVRQNLLDATTPEEVITEFTKAVEA